MAPFFIAVDFPGDATLIAGYMLVGKELKSLPIGSTLDLEAGKFYWQPGLGFVGEYRFEAFLPGRSIFAWHVFTKIIDFSRSSCNYCLILVELKT